MPAATATVVAAAVALGLAVTSPFAVAALGLMVFGSLHIVLELRYVLGRFRPVLGGGFGWGLLVLLTAIMVSRGLTGLLPQTGRIEIVLGFAVLALGCWFGLRGTTRLLVLCLVALTMTISLVWVSAYFFVLTHLHNLVPLAFLWDWSSRLSKGRGWFVAANLLWAVAVPATVLSGLCDPLLGGLPAWLEPLVGDGSALITAASGGVGGVEGLRYLVVFAFMQSMHYFVWILFLPLAAPDVSRAFGEAFPALRGWRVWALGLALCALVLGVFAFHYPSGKALYGLIAVYHVYIEFPLLVALWANRAPVRTPV